MNNNQGPTVDELRRLSQVIILEMEKTEEHVQQMNLLLTELARNNELATTMLLGDVIHDTRNKLLYASDEQARLLQAVIDAGHGGIGVIVWDVSQFEQFRRKAPIRSNEETLNFTPFAACPSEVKRLLLPHLGPLIDRFVHLAQR